MRALLLTCLLLQAAPTAPSLTVITKHSDPQVRNVQTLFSDDVVVFVARTFGDRRDTEKATEPGLFVQSKERSRWLQIVAISTAGGRLGRSWTDDPQAQKKLRTAPVGWDFTQFAGKPYIDQPLRTTGSVTYPDHIAFDEATGLYELKYFSSFGVPSAETVLYVRRSDLVDAFSKR